MYVKFFTYFYISEASEQFDILGKMDERIYVWVQFLADVFGSTGQLI